MRSQKFAMGGEADWEVQGRSPQPPEASGSLRAKPEAAGAAESGGSMSRWRFLLFFEENNPFLGTFCCYWKGCKSSNFRLFIFENQRIFVNC